jgi:hypothetical protein
MSSLISGARPMSNNYLLNLYEKALKLPAGRKIFSMVFSRKAPYFATITPTIAELRPNFCKVTFKKRKGVENHIQTVHVIAICNAMECASIYGGFPKAWT